MQPEIRAVDEIGAAVVDHHGVDDVGRVIGAGFLVKFRDRLRAGEIVVHFLPEAGSDLLALVAVENGQRRDRLLQRGAALVVGNVFLRVPGAGGDGAEDVGELRRDEVVEAGLRVSLVALLRCVGAEGFADAREDILAVQFRLQHPGEVVHAGDAHVEAADLVETFAQQVQVALLFPRQVMTVAKGERLHARMPHHADCP